MKKHLPLPSIILSVLFLFPMSYGFSQVLGQRFVEESPIDNYRYGLMDLGIYHANPLGEFNSDGYKQGFGFNMGLFSRALSAENGLAALRLGGRMTVDFSGRSEGDMIAPVPGTSEFGEMHLENSSLGLFGALRIESTPRFPVQVYLEGLLGTRSLMTSESFNDHFDFGEGEECVDNTVLRDWSLAYGASAGTLIRLTSRMKLDLRATYMTGRPSQFVDLASAQQVEDNLYQYNTEIAAPTQLQLQAGLSFDVDFRCAPTRSSLACGSRPCRVASVAPEVSLP